MKVRVRRSGSVATAHHILQHEPEEQEQMKSFQHYLREAMEKTATFTFGRFQPPTIGHEKLLKAVKTASRGGAMYVFTSQTNDRKDNPLTHSEKTDTLKQMFPAMASSISTEGSVKTIIDAAKFLESKGFARIKLVVGEDRVGKFEKLLGDYNGKEYNFSSIEVVSAGMRDPDDDGVEGMSASKMRAAVRAGDKDAFAKGLPKAYKNKEWLFDTLKGRMK